MEHSLYPDFFSISVAKSINSDCLIKLIMIVFIIMVGRYVRAQSEAWLAFERKRSPQHFHRSRYSCNWSCIWSCDKNAFQIVIKIKIAFLNMIWYDSITHTANNHELTLHRFSAASFDLCQKGVIIPPCADKILHFVAMLCNNSVDWRSFPCIVNHWREHQWLPTAGGVNTRFDVSPFFSLLHYGLKVNNDQLV